MEKFSTPVKFKKEMEQRSKAERDTASTRLDDCFEETEGLSNNFESFASSSKNEVGEYKREQTTTDTVVPSVSMLKSNDGADTERSNITHLELDKKPKNKKKKCMYCEKTFMTQEYLSRHVKNHEIKTEVKDIGQTNSDSIVANTGRREYNNAACTEKNRNKDLELAKESKNKTYKCEYCKKTFTKQSCLSRHMKNHGIKNTKEKYDEISSGSEIVNTDRTNTDRVNETSTDKDLELVTSKKNQYKCQYCDKTFTRQNYLSRHQQTHAISNEESTFDQTSSGSAVTNVDRTESNNEIDTKTSINKDVKPPKKMHKCEFCNKTFTRKNCLSRHARIHTGERPYGCQVCEQRFVEHGAMKVHYRIHTGERPFMCSYCSRSFRHKSNLTLHERRHLNDKRYKCTLCNKTFISPGNCKKHERSHSNEKLYKCEGCSQSFKTRKGLSRHEMTHDGSIHKCNVCQKDSSCAEPKEQIKQFKCELCDKTFNKATSLKIHYRTHTGEKPYKCDTCHKSYARLGTLRKHQNIHITDRNYKCNLCNKAFNVPLSLALHKRMHARAMHGI